MTQESPRIEPVAPGNLIPAPDNPRCMPPQQTAALERSIAEFGLVDPIIVRKQDRTVIGGHQRLEAAKRLGLTEVPVVFLDVSKAQAQTLRIAVPPKNAIWGF